MDLDISLFRIYAILFRTLLNYFILRNPTKNKEHINWIT